jgi:hypothetical protein
MICHSPVIITSAFQVCALILQQLSFLNLPRWYSSSALSAARETLLQCLIPYRMLRHLLSLLLHDMQLSSGEQSLPKLPVPAIPTKLFKAFWYFSSHKIASLLCCSNLYCIAIAAKTLSNSESQHRVRATGLFENRDIARSCISDCVRAVFRHSSTLS